VIGNTTPATALTLQASLDKGTYPTGIKVTDQQRQELNLYPAAFHGQDWN